MRRLTRSLLLSAVILAAVCLAAGCSSTVSSVSNAISSIASSRNGATSSADAPDQSPSDTSPTPTITSPTTSVTTVTVTPTVTTTTVTPSVTVSVSPSVTVSVSPSVSTVSGSPAASSGSGTSLLWLWILLGALVLIGIILLIMRSVGRRNAAAAGWRSKVIDVYAKGSALYDAMSVAEAPGALAASDAAARWYDIQRRADDLTQTLYALRETAPNEDDRGRVANALVSLQAARSAMDAERAPGGAGPMHAETVRARLRDFEASLRALRDSDQPTA
jgi:hypothetical protein